MGVRALSRERDKGRWRRFLIWGMLLALCGVSPAEAAVGDPLKIFTPTVGPLALPPTGYLHGPCGLAVDSSGNVHLSDHHHRTVDVFTPSFAYVDQLTNIDPVEGNPCGVAVDSVGAVYANVYHGIVRKYPPASLPNGPLTAFPSTGVAVNPATNDVYVNARTYVAAFNAFGTPLMNGGSALKIGFGDLGNGYGLARSNFPGTAGFIYVSDAASDTVRVYNPAVNVTKPVQTITGPPGGFASLHDSAVAVDDAGGDIYVIDTLGPQFSEQPQASVYAFSSNGTYKGRLKYNIIDGGPSGLAVDNTGGSTQGRVYVTSGFGERASVYAYPPEAATGTALPAIPPAKFSSPSAFSPTVPIGGAAPPGTSPHIVCLADACSILDNDPGDPTLTTRLSGPGNPRVRYSRHAGNCRQLVGSVRDLNRRAGRLNRLSRGAVNRAAAERLAARAEKLTKRARRVAQAARRCNGANRSRASISMAAADVTRKSPLDHFSDSSYPPVNVALLSGEDGFSAAVRADGGAAATLAGSHPYQVDFNVALQPSGGAPDLRGVRIDLPPGLMANPTAVTSCSSTAFDVPRASPSQSGENCPSRSQVGTIDIRTGTGGNVERRFGLFNLAPEQGAASQIGASPYGFPLIFTAVFREAPNGEPTLGLQATGIPQGLDLRSLKLSLWGIPWNASHNGERGNCLNEVEPDFPRAKCLAGASSPSGDIPRAYLTLPSACSAALAFELEISTWQEASTTSAQAINRDAGGQPAPIERCEELQFLGAKVHGALTTTKPASPSGFVFTLTQDEDPGLVDPNHRIASHPHRITVELPDGVTLNTALADGLVACSPAEYAAETPFNPHGEGCPPESNIGDFSFRTPLYTGVLEGAIYLAKPDDKGTLTPGAENPLDSLVAVYLVAKSADRGILLRLTGKIVPDPASGNLVAVFDGLPQLPYIDIEVNFRTGQRAPLHTPPRCGPATTRTVVTPWAGATKAVTSTVDSPIVGSSGAPCPDGSAPPFAPEVIAGGVNSNVGYYTTYFIRISRQATNQQITSYSLVLPKGITGKLAGIPFCPDAAIDIARQRGGFAEAAAPSCPEASRVGRTVTSYSAGNARAFAPGNIYLAGPYHGSPLSLVTINSATVGSFDLGTIVIRSAFDIDPHTAQLQIDSSASDPIPHIVQGFPLNMRDIRIYLDRPAFAHNPSSCEPSQLISTVTGAGARLEDPLDDTSVTVTEHFQLLNCLTLDFRPKLGLRLRGGSRRGAYPSLRATLAARGARDSNLKRIEVLMPHSLFLAQNHIRQVCSRGQFAAEICPASSVYGKAVLFTPLFDAPLRGNVYLRSSSSRLPDLVASLRSGEVRIILEGKIGPSESADRSLHNELAGGSPWLAAELLQYLSSAAVCRSARAGPEQHRRHLLLAAARAMQ
jgi:hypothetical protein